MAAGERDLAAAQAGRESRGGVGSQDGRMAGGSVQMGKGLCALALEERGSVWCPWWLSGLGTALSSQLLSSRPSSWLTPRDVMPGSPVGGQSWGWGEMQGPGPQD